MKLICKQFALSLLLAMMSITMAQAVAPVGKQVTGTIALQGGSNSAVKYMAPSTAAYKVHVLVPKTGKTPNALYRVYPKGKRAGSTSCLSTDATFPCYEITVDQTQHQNTWVQLVLDNDTATQWDFVKGKGYVTALAGNLSAVEMLNLSAVVRFVNPIAVAEGIRYGVVRQVLVTDFSSPHQPYPTTFVNLPNLQAFVDALTPLETVAGQSVLQVPGNSFFQIPAMSFTEPYAYLFVAIPTSYATTYSSIKMGTAGSLTDVTGLNGPPTKMYTEIVGSDGVTYDLYTPGTVDDFVINPGILRLEIL